MLITGCASLSPHSTNYRLLTIVAFRSGSNSTTCFSARSLDAIWTAGQGFPDGITRFHARRFHFIAFGDDAGPVVPQHADRHALQMRKSHSLGGGVKAIRVDVTNGVHAPRVTVGLTITSRSPIQAAKLG